jgi:multidrug efflux pump subunit AcrA (membrane-fusion protein)
MALVSRPIRLAAIAAASVLALVALAAATGGLPFGESPPPQQQEAAAWVCPMHPDVRQAEPGRCPICGMALEQQAPPEQSSAHQEAHGAHAGAASPPRPSVTPPSAADEAEPRAPVTIDGRRQQLVGVRLVEVRREPLTHTVRAQGIVRFDESRWTDVNVRTEGWIRTLHVDRTGDRVRRGQPLLALYSPELATVQAEYLLALRTRDAGADAASPSGAQAARLVEAARQRLARWDLPDEHVASLAGRRDVPPLVVFRSPVSGIVMEKKAVEGMRVMPGDTLFRIVDPSAVWIEADVYEADVALVRVGQKATATVEAWPGDTFPGRVSWTAPTVDETTRTIKVRIELPNKGGRLKPGMFAETTLATEVPHGPVVPMDAVLDTGGSQFVFVSEGDGYFEPRRVRIGRQVNGRGQVLEGVTAGEQVAASATFFIDSESQLRAALEGYKATPAPAPAAGGGRSSLDIALRSTPDPPRAGVTQFEALVKTPAGAPVTDASVSLVLYMPAMPSMNMPAMRSEAALGHAGNGVYRGSIDVMMNGRWEATVTVTRGSERLATKQLTLIAR